METRVLDNASHQQYGTHLAIFLLAMGVRAFFLLRIDEPVLFYKYLYFAEKLAAGQSIGERLTDLSPFYLYFLTAFKWLLGLDWDYVKYVQSLLGAMNCLVLYALGRRLIGRQAAFIAAFFYAAYGNLVILESTLEPEVFLLFFNLLTLYLLVVAKKDKFSHPRGWLPLFAAGLFAGLSVITKPNFLLFVPVGAAWIVWVTGGPQLSLIRRIGLAALFCAGTLLLILPITLRNYFKLNDVILVTADAGKVFYHGNGPNATALEGTGLPDEGFAEEAGNEPDYAHVLYRRTASKLSGRPMRPSESSRFWFNETLRNIRANPADFLRLGAKKVLYFFHNYEMHYIASAYKEYKASLSYPLIRFGVLSALALVGAALSLRTSKDLFLVYAVALTYLLSATVFVVQSRYRTPAVPYLCLFAGIAVDAFRRKLTDRAFGPVAVYAVALTAALLVTHLPFKAEIRAMDRWQQATKIHYQLGAVPLFRAGRYQDAVTELDAALALAPRFSPAYNLRGKCYAILEKLEPAILDFQKVLALSPGIPEGYKNLGLLYLMQGRRDEAEPYLRKALQMNPDDPKISDALGESPNLRNRDPSFGPG